MNVRVQLSLVGVRTACAARQFVMPALGCAWRRPWRHRAVWRPFCEARTLTSVRGMTTKRRSKFTRSSARKRLILSPRDLRVFQALKAYRYLPLPYLFRFAGGLCEKRFTERMGDLFHEGFLGRPEQQWTYSQWRHTVYELDGGAKHALRDDGEDCAPATFLAERPHRQFAHALMICQCVASIELATQSRQGIRFIAWPEILARAPAATQVRPLPHAIPLGSASLIPDGVFGLEYREQNCSRYRFFALEVDRGTMPFIRSDRVQSSLTAKLELYRELLATGAHQRHWGISRLLVLVVLNRPQRLTQLLRRSDAKELSAMFLFKTKAEASLYGPALDLLTESWTRAGAAPLNIGGIAPEASRESR